MRHTSWDRARLSVVVPIGVIVAVAILCIVIAVLSSARRADEVAIQHEQQLLSRALDTHGEQVLREVASIASSQSAIQNIRLNFDPVWANHRIGLSLQGYFEHDYVFVFDGDDNPIYVLTGTQPATPAWIEALKPELMPVIDYMRGRVFTLRGGVRVNAAAMTEGGAHPQAAIITRIERPPGGDRRRRHRPGRRHPARARTARR